MFRLAHCVRLFLCAVVIISVASILFIHHGNDLDQEEIDAKLSKLIS
jgi:hypothetical protein